MALETLAKAIEGIVDELQAALILAISEIEDDAERAEMADRFADAIAEVSPDFDRAVFISACGVIP